MRERRNLQRMTVEIGELAVLPVHMSVRVLDISLSGVLLQSAHPVERGAHGSLRLNLDGVPFVTDVEVQRISCARYCHGQIGRRRIRTRRRHRFMSRS